jgi:membrane protein DedA with SNARE-associated domain
MSAFLTNLVSTYGYWLIFAVVGLESVGLPLPGETTLIAAAVYAGATHRLSITLVIALAVVGAMLGDNLGFFIGRAGGYQVLRRYGRYVRLDEPMLKVAEYLFQRYGSWIVFIGRFVSMLRIFAAFLAGESRMPWKRFAASNAAAIVLWANGVGLLGFELGSRFVGPAGIASVVAAGAVLGAVSFILRRSVKRLEQVAEKALPGPLADYHQSRRRDESAA